jgi:DNA polymerase III sliding clamp (beta) subunit (PCNA family)
MQIERKYKIEKCVSTDSTRTNMTNIFITKRHAMATNGHMLAVVPVTFESEDTNGWLTPAALTQARKVTPKSAGDVVISLNGAQELIDGTRIVRPTEEKPPKFVHLLRLAHKDREFKIGLDAAKLKALADALGSDELVLDFGSTKAAVLVTPFHSEAGTIGLLMPLRIDNR